MARLIDVEPILMRWNTESLGRKEMYDMVKDAPVIEIVLCKDCKYWDKETLRHNSNDVAEWDECECEMLARRDRWNEIDRYCCGLHFCADGERRDDELQEDDGRCEVPCAE